MFLRSIKYGVLPSNQNSYRPALLRREALIFFLALILLAEGFFVANLFVQNSVHSFVAATAIAAPVGATHSLTDTLSRVATKILTDPSTSTAWALGSVLLVLCTALAFTFFIHMRVQPAELLLPGTLVASMAVMFLFLNAHFFPDLETVQTQPSAVSSYSVGLSSAE